MLLALKLNAPNDPKTGAPVRGWLIVDPAKGEVIDFVLEGRPPSGKQAVYDRFPDQTVWFLEDRSPCLPALRVGAGLVREMAHWAAIAKLGIGPRPAAQVQEETLD